MGLRPGPGLVDAGTYKFLVDVISCVIETFKYRPGITRDPVDSG